MSSSTTTAYGSPAEGASLYGAFTLGRAVTEADVLISLPKLKTHGFMMFTGAVKNLFGCIPGLDKAQYHLKVPDRDDFGAMLVDLMLACKPALAVMDAVVGMEGDGPAGGSPRHVGALLASADCLALDVVASAIAGLDPKEVYSNKAGLRRGLCPGSADEVEIVGVGWRELAPENFALPTRDLSAKMPAWLARGCAPGPRRSPCSRGRRTARSASSASRSARWVRSRWAQSGPVFDHSICIRCYCCQELCPPQAIGLSVPRVAKLMTRGRGK